MCNDNLQWNLRGGGDGYGISWIGDLGDAQNPWRMLRVDIQCFIMHISGQLFECECLGVISAILELQFTNHNWKSCLEFLQRNGTWPYIELLNSLRGTIFNFVCIFVAWCTMLDCASHWLFSNLSLQFNFLFNFFSQFFIGFEFAILELLWLPRNHNVVVSCKHESFVTWSQISIYVYWYIIYLGSTNSN